MESRVAFTFYSKWNHVNGRDRTKSRFGIEVIYSPRQSCISSLVLSVSDICGEMFVVCSGETIRRTNDTIRRDTKLECDHNTRKERDSYFFHVRNWTWRFLQKVLKPVEVMICQLWLLSMNHLCTSEQTVSGTTGKEIFRKIQTVLFSFVVYLFERSTVWFSLLVLKMSSSVVVHAPKSWPSWLWRNNPSPPSP